MLKKKIWANFQSIIELFTQKIVTKLSKIRVPDRGSEIRDPGSGIWDPRSEIRGPGSGMGKNQDLGSKINIPDPQHFLQIS